MKYILHGTCSTFSEVSNSIDTNHVCKEFHYNLFSVPYIFQALVGILVFLSVNAAIIIFALFVDLEAFCLFLLNLMLIPATGAVTVHWMEHTWEKKNKTLIDATLKEWDDKSEQEIAEAEEWRKKHPLEEKCRIAFEHQNINSVAVASILRELIPEEE